MIWVADFTYIRITHGFCYLAVILDACSRKVVGCALSRRLGVDGFALSSNKQKTPPSCVHYTDRGCQYASEIYQRALDVAWLQGSMSAIGNPYHNAHAESFMKTLKGEGVDIAGHDNFTDVAEGLPRFIEQVYIPSVYTRLLAIDRQRNSKPSLAQRAGLV